MGTEQQHHADIVVIGAGMAGLAAAGDLAEHGRRVLVLEAKERAGGRVCSTHQPGWPIPLELGAEFIDVPGAAWDILRDAGQAVVRSTGGIWEIDGGTARPLDLGHLSGLLERLDPDEPDRPFADWLESRSDITETDRRRLRRFVEGFHAADLDRVGTRWLSRASTGSEGGSGGGGAARYMALAGFARVADALRTRLLGRGELRLETVATDIAWQPGRVDVGLRSADGAPLPTVRARAAIITLPPTLLRGDGRERAALTFHPALPARHEAARAITLGSVLKVLLCFRSAFWEAHLEFRDPDKAPARERKLFMCGEPFPTWWTASPVVAPTLTAWAGGDAAARVHDLGDPVSVALDSLARLLRVSRSAVDAELMDARFHDWDTDPFARGAYSWAPAGSLDAFTRLAEPVENTLFFAGEATAEPARNGTVDGAIESGRRAAAHALVATRT